MANILFKINELYSKFIALTYIKKPGEEGDLKTKVREFVKGIR